MATIYLICLMQGMDLSEEARRMTMTMICYIEL